ncbi:MAG: hypothetical protein ABIT08_15415 [Bacteroidia bacterium]
MSFQHQSLAGGKWFELSLCSQMGNIGSEIGRAKRWQKKDQKNFEAAVFRAIELIDLTLSDVRWKHRSKEIARAKEVICDAYLDGKEYGSGFESLEKYFYHFAFAARNSIGK